jgi:hypothetical protein
LRPKADISRPTVWNGPWSISTFSVWLTKVTFGKPGDQQSALSPQNLDELGDPSARVTKDEVNAAFGKQSPKKSK